MQWPGPALGLLHARVDNGNGNGAGGGAGAWGTLEDGSTALYAMSANQGIQAFAVIVVTEPGTYYALLAIGLGGIFIFRRRP